MKAPRWSSQQAQYLCYVGCCWPVPCPELWRELTANDVRHLVGKPSMPIVNPTRMLAGNSLKPRIVCDAQRGGLARS
jgi:hypothetical protein